MADADDEDGDSLVFDPGNDPVVTHAKAPKCVKIRTLQRRAEASGIIRDAEPFAKVPPYAIGNSPIELAEIADRGAFEIKAPDQDSS